jgi:hypothetical protein
MLKFLRQYNQWILVVGGTLLLITFLMPTAIQNCAQESAVSGATWATYDGDKLVTGADLEASRGEMRVVELVGNQVLNSLGADRDPAHWWLLTHEAAQAGLVGGLGDGEAIVVQMAAQRAEAAKTNPNMGGTTPDALMGELVRNSRTNRDVVLNTLAKMQGVSRLVNLSANIDRVSNARFEHAAAQALLGVSGDMFIVDARVIPAIEPSPIQVAAVEEALLAEHFKKFADKPAPVGGKPGRDNFGYRIPDQVKLEWLTIPKASVAASVQNAPELATLALKKRFAQDPAKYGAPADGSGTFTAFESAVRSKTTDELVTQRLDAIAKFATDQLGLAQRTLKRDGAYFALPTDWASQMPGFPSLAQSIAAEFAIESPIYRSSGESWMGPAELEADPILGQLSTDRFGVAIRLPQLVAGAKELSANNLNAPFQLNIASPPLVSNTGDVTFVRLISAETSRPAADLAAVRDAVVRDVLSIARFEWLEKNQDAIAQQVVAEGIRPVAAKYGSEVLFANELREANPQFVTYGIRLANPIPGLGTDAKALAAIIQKASKLPATADLSTIPVAERTFTVPAADQLSLVVIQVSALAPLTIEQYREIAANPQSVGIVRDPNFGINPSIMFNFESLAKRHDFKLTRLEGDEDEAAAESAEASASSTANNA